VLAPLRPTARALVSLQKTDLVDTVKLNADRCCAMARRRTDGPRADRCDSAASSIASSNPPDRQVPRRRVTSNSEYGVAKVPRGSTRWAAQGGRDGRPTGDRVHLDAGYLSRILARVSPGASSSPRRRSVDDGRKKAIPGSRWPGRRRVHGSRPRGGATADRSGSLEPVGPRAQAARSRSGGAMGANREPSRQLGHTDRICCAIIARETWLDRVRRRFLLRPPRSTAGARVRGGAFGISWGRLLNRIRTHARACWLVRGSPEKWPEISLGVGYIHGSPPGGAHGGVRESCGMFFFFFLFCDVEPGRAPSTGIVRGRQLGARVHGRSRTAQTGFYSRDHDVDEQAWIVSARRIFYEARATRLVGEEGAPDLRQGPRQARPGSFRRFGVRGRIIAMATRSGASEGVRPGRHVRQGLQSDDFIRPPPDGPGSSRCKSKWGAAAALALKHRLRKAVRLSRADCRSHVSNQARFAKKRGKGLRGKPNRSSITATRFRAAGLGGQGPPASQVGRDRRVSADGPGGVRAARH